MNYNTHASKLHTGKIYILHSQMITMNHLHHNHFTTLFPGPPGWAGAIRKLLDFMVQGKINRGRHTDHPNHLQYSV